MHKCPLLLSLCASLATAAPQRGANLVADPSFEAATQALANAWRPCGQGYSFVREGAQNGRVCIKCEPTGSDEVWGAMQEVTFDPPLRHPFRVSGWSKAEKAEGYDYCLYMDCWYDDGTNLWGQRKSFETGTHDWQSIDYTFHPTKPITKIQYFILFRRCTGKAWFDNVSLSLERFAIEDAKAKPSLYGGNSLDFRARLSLPAAWTASVLRDGREAFATNGTGQDVVFSWGGTDQSGRLLPGGDYTVRLSAKDDLLAETLRHETPVQTKSGRGRGYVAWAESSMKRVLVNAWPTAQADRLAAGIALARNEYESFQVALRAAPGRELEDCTVELADLKDRTGHVIPRAMIEWHQVGFVKLAELFPHPKMKHAAPGWWPDPLLPVKHFDVPGGVTQAVWFTVYAPPGTPAGQYSARFAIRPSNAPAQPVNVAVEVFDFSIPTQPHIKTAFALMDGYLEKIYGKPLSPELRRAYGDYVLRHRLNPDDISRTDPPHFDDLAHYDSRGLNAFNVLNLVQHRGKRTWVCWSPLKVYTPELKARLIERLDPYVAELKRRGLADKAYVYTFDERRDEFFPVIKEYFGLIKERYGIPTLTTAKVPQDPKVMQDLNVDWNCPVLSRYVFEDAEKCRAAGLQVWSYVCLGPRYPFANWLADDPLIEARVLWWQVYHQKMEGFLYWGLNIWSRRHNDYLIDPETDGPRLRWSITTGGKRWPRLHGDGMMLYPAKDGPLGCIRLANIRDGIEDYEYLWQLAKLTDSAENAREACLPVTQSLTAFTRDPETLGRQRATIARRIVSR